MENVPDQDSVKTHETQIKIENLQNSKKMCNQIQICIGPCATAYSESDSLAPQKNWLNQCLRELNPMENVPDPDQDSVENQIKT